MKMKIGSKALLETMLKKIIIYYQNTNNEEEVEDRVTYTLQFYLSNGQCHHYNIEL